MHLDLNDASGAMLRATDICIIGAGAAGISMARQLLEQGHDVILLESGGLDYEAAIAALNAGENIGEAYYDLEDSRLRFFGGTTAIWGGRVAELDEIDFQARPWVPYSGWPFSKSALRPYYDRARRLFGLPSRRLTAEDLAASGVALPSFNPDRLDPLLWTFDGRFNRFTFDACSDLVRHPRCQIITHATVTEIVAHRSARGITQVEARSLAGNSLTVQARMFVLAAGGLENPRLLLASRSVMPQGLGNAHDLVGRFFMEHPHARGGKVITKRAWMLLNAFGRRHIVDGQQVAALLRPSEDWQAATAMLNSSLTIAGRQPAGAAQNWGMRAYGKIKHEVAPTRAGRMIWMLTKQASSWAQRKVDPLRPWLLHKLGMLDLALVVRAEQAPHPDSRVRLLQQGDALGMPRIALDWRLTELDVASVEQLVRAVDTELRRLGLGHIEPAAWLSERPRRWRTDPLISAHPIGGYHHMGTTRMADDPTRGVTDGYGRVHGIDNLYVAGSSLFPTSGWANPTLTIVALGLRTADMISNRLRHPTPLVAQREDQEQPPSLITARVMRRGGS